MRIERLRERLHGYVRAQAWDAAALTLARWREEHPGDFEVELHATRVLLLSGRYRDAFATVSDAARHLVCPPQLLLETMLCLQQFAAGAAMTECLRRFDQSEQMTPPDLARCASVLMRFGMAEPAAKLLRNARAKAPDDPLCLINQGFLQFYIGDTVAATECLEHLIQGPEDVAMAHWLLSQLRRQTQHSNHLARLRQRFWQSGLHDDDRAYLGFALFKELDDLGEHEAAWQALSAANALLAKLHRYDPSVMQSRFDRIRQQFADDVAMPTPSGNEPTPIFIVGMHRSGTSLVEHLLSAVPSLLACGESQRLRAAIAYAMTEPTSADEDALPTLDPRNCDFALAARHFFTLTAGLGPEVKFVTEKWPLNFQYLGFVKHIFPDAKVIHVRRDPLDVCFANFRQRFSDGVAHPNALADLAHYHNAYIELMRYWHERYPGFILDLRYEQLVKQPEVEMRRVFDFCGIDDETASGQNTPRQTLVATLSAVQVRHPIHATSVGRYLPYRRWLAPLQDLLESRGQ